MRKFKAVIVVDGNDHDEVVFRVDDDATPEEIERKAKEIYLNFLEYCGYYHYEIEDENED